LTGSTGVTPKTFTYDASGIMVSDGRMGEWFQASKMTSCHSNLRSQRTSTVTKY